MADFATFDDLRGFASAGDTRTILKEASRSRAGKTIFLSHSSKDVDLLPGVIKVLEGHGGSVYVDLDDNRLPDTPSAETGQIIRDSISACRKLVVFVTTNSQDSKWVPWELGYGDANKSERHVCLFPAAANSYIQSWAGQEYLGIYDRIVWGQLQGHSKDLWMVLNHHKNSAVTLSEWIRR